MVQITINSIIVDFPYEPYPPQIRYMSHVIDALRSGQNALLESPTGTGKTLCLLCATLAWRVTYIAALQAHALSKPPPIPSSTTSGDTPEQQQYSDGAASSINNPMDTLLSHAGIRPLPGASTSALLSAFAPQQQPQPQTQNEQKEQKAVADLATPRIIYASRTHSQLSQAISELKKTIYTPSMSLVASRDQLCIHDISSTHTGSRLNAMCRRLTAPSRRSCRYHLPVASPRPYENRSAELISKLLHEESPLDIEDLRSFGTSQSSCPYYLSRLAAKSDECEILFLPYNYLIDSSIRASLDIDWSNDVIIIDEAHNLESICADAVSFDLTENMRKNCDNQFSKFIQSGLNPGGLSIPALENLVKDGNVDKVIGSENRDLLEIRLMRTIMVAVEEFINSADLNRGKEHSDISFAVYPAQKLRKIMQDAGGPTLDTYELFLEMLDRAMDMQVHSLSATDDIQQQQNQQQQQSNNALRSLQTAIRVLFESVLSGKEQCFRTVIQYNTSKPTSGRTLSHWCFNPSVGMSSFTSLNARCLLLTSGTLSPLESFASELGLPFPVRLENPHVVTSLQVWAGVIHTAPSLPNERPTTTGSRTHRLTSAYFARGDDSSVDLGRCILRFAETIPDGLLIFYPSYASLYSCVEAWKRLGPGANRCKPSIWEHLLRLKSIVTEERDSSKVSAAVLAHRANVDSGNGSILLAVCRGKVSEGIDFSDEYGRAVVITGLPYPSAMDPKIVLKREYADEEARKQPRIVGNTSKNKVLNGTQWYSAQALRAVNQAIGRAIRHRFDYGAILLCDERFQSVPLQGQISKWIRPNLKIHPTFENAQSSLNTFFADAVDSEFAKEGDKRRSNALTRGSRERSAAEDNRRRLASQRRNTEQDTRAVVVAQGAIDRLLRPPTTEAQFVDQMVSISDEIKAGQDIDLQCELNRKQSNHDQQPHSQSQRKKKTVCMSAVEQLSSQCAKGGLRDSGNAVAENAAAITTQPNILKRSALFLASRSQRINETDSGSSDRRKNEGTAVKRIKRTGSSVAAMMDRSQSQGQPRQPVKLSEKIKKMFDKGDVRPFLELFRRLLAANSKVVDGVGPLQSEQELQQTRETGINTVKQIVKFTRDKAVRGSGVPSPRTFLQELRSKIPSTFQQYYDEVIRQ